jgi:hypothetical protein
LPYWRFFPIIFPESGGIVRHSNHVSSSGFTRIPYRDEKHPEKYSGKTGKLFFQRNENAASESGIV